MIIGLSGYAQSGKDTAGAILVHEHSFTRVAFADKMKEIALAIDPVIDWYNNPPNGGRPVHLAEVIDAVGWERAKTNPEVRRFLQRLGTEAGRKILGENFWTELAFRGWQAGADWVFTDVRFPNEADAIVVRGGVVVRVHRPGTTAPNDHVSEHALANYPAHYELYNDGTVTDLLGRVNSMVEWAGASHA